MGQPRNAYLALQRFDDARKTIREAQGRKLDDYVTRNALYALAFLLSDSAGMAEQRQWYAGKPEENHGLSLDSDTEAYAGLLNKARALTRQSVESAIHADSKENGAIWLENSALREAAFGDAVEARAAAAEGLKLAPASQGVASEAALAFAMAGDTVQAEALAKELNTRYPLDTQIQTLWLPSIQAQIALNRKAPADALRIMQAPSDTPADLGQIVFADNISCLYKTYILRGKCTWPLGIKVPLLGTFRGSSIITAWSGTAGREL